MDQSTRIFWGAVAGAAVVVSAVLVVVLRNSGDGGTAAEQPAGTTPAVQPVVVRSAVLGPPTEFGSVVVTDHVLRVSPAGYAVEVRYPVVSGIADPARQERINARLRAPADEAMAGLVAGFGRYPAGSGGSATVSADTSVIGKFVTVQFESVTHHPGAESIERGADAITVRLDTAAPVTASAMFTADGRSDRGQRAIARGLRPQDSFADCEAGDAEVLAAVAGLIRGDGAGSVSVGVDGLVFTFPGSAVGPGPCDFARGLLTYQSLDHLVDPGLVKLATGSR
jgi:hypothetical protein